MGLRGLGRYVFLCAMTLRTTRRTMKRAKANPRSCVSLVAAHVRSVQAQSAVWAAAEEDARLPAAEATIHASAQEPLLFKLFGFSWSMLGFGRIRRSLG